MSSTSSAKSASQPARRPAHDHSESAVAASPKGQTAHATPLWAVLLFAFLCSIGSAIVYGGVFFLAESQYGFSQRDNFLLALLFGLAYMPGAALAGPALRRLRTFGLMPRTVLVGLMLGMGGLCFVPILAARLGTPTATWPIWVTIGAYSPLSGAMWPIVESFLAGGRTEEQLRAATGRFNVTWSGAIVLTMFAMAGLYEHHALELVASLGVVHLICIGILACFDAAPAAHEHHEHHRPLVYRQLLTFLRMLLPVSFMFNSTLSPYLPTALKAIGVAPVWKTPVAAAWYSARCLTFAAMERWHGWHGRWTTPVLGAVLMLASFAWVVIVPLLTTGSLGLPLFVVGLAGFGVGVGIIYASALYYAMEVGSSGVDAGGTHETLIGLGYTAGPVFGLAGLGAAGAQWIAPGSAPIAMLTLVAVTAAGAAGVALWKAFHLSRS